MAVIDMPSGPAFGVAQIVFNPTSPKAAWQAAFTGQVQSISHLGDRLRATLRLRPCSPADGAVREAFFTGLNSTGDWVRLAHWRTVPYGTLRGTPTAAASAAAGARTLQVQTTAGATLLGGDVLGANGQLLMTGYAGAVANGSGVMTLPLALPLRTAVSAGAALTWQAPLGTFQLADEQLGHVIGRAGWHAALEVTFVEAY